MQHGRKKECSERSPSPNDDSGDDADHKAAVINKTRFLLRKSADLASGAAPREATSLPRKCLLQGCAWWQRLGGGKPSVQIPSMTVSGLPIYF